MREVLFIHFSVTQKSYSIREKKKIIIDKIINLEFEPAIIACPGRCFSKNNVLISMLTPDDGLKPRNIYIEIKTQNINLFYFCEIYLEMLLPFFIIKMFHLELTPNSLKVLMSS